MSLNLFDILQEVLNESVSSSEVNDAINNRYQVIINYRDEKSRAVEKRLIEPYVYGITKAGNEAFRAYQYQGDTFRGIPKWKLFRMDRVESWEPTGRHFNQQPREKGWRAENYNSGDKSLPTILNYVKFDDDIDDGIFRTEYEKNLIKRRKAQEKSTPININQLQNSMQPPPTNVSRSPERDIPVPDNVDIDVIAKSGPEETNSLYKELSDVQWDRDSKSDEDKRIQNIIKRREKRAANRMDTSKLWRKGAQNEEF